MLQVSKKPSGKPEIFHSIQGEGITAGSPSVFLRLAKCNLTCTWCDTKYTWDWTNYDINDQLLLMSVDEVESRVTAFKTRRLVITGGEPMLQQRELLRLTTSLHSQGYVCEIETNGTIAPETKMANTITQWNISPKLSNSRNDHNRREIKKPLCIFAGMDNTYFKFVIVKPEDVREVSFLANRYQIEPNKIILMPEGTNVEILNERGTWLAEACLANGYRFSTRLHIQLWGDIRGK